MRAPQAEDLFFGALFLDFLAAFFFSGTSLLVAAFFSAAFAALLSGRFQPKPQERVGVLLCGGNTTAVNFAPREKRVSATVTN